MPRRSFHFVDEGVWPGGPDGDGTDLFGNASFRPPRRVEQRIGFEAAGPDFDPNGIRAVVVMDEDPFAAEDEMIAGIDARAAGTAR